MSKSLIESALNATGILVDAHGSFNNEGFDTGMTWFN